MVLNMNKDKIKEILDKTNIYVLDEADIIEYIDELENRIDKAIEYFTRRDIEWGSYEQKVLLDILRGKNEED